jgi:hypothetical protein
LPEDIKAKYKTTEHKGKITLSVMRVADPVQLDETGASE